MKPILNKSEDYLQYINVWRVISKSTKIMMVNSMCVERGFIFFIEMS